MFKVIMFIFSFLYSLDPYSEGYGLCVSYFPIMSNPTTFGDIRNITTSASYADIKHEKGFERKYRSSSFAFFYPSVFKGKNLTYMIGYERMRFRDFISEVKRIGFASYHAFDMEDSYMDIGFSLKRISKADGFESKNSYDGGFIVRKKDYVGGFSFENLNAGVGGYKYGIPESISFSVSRFISDYLVGLTISKSSFEDKSSFVSSFSASQIIRTYRYGYFRLSTSMSFSSIINWLSFGVFYNREVWEFSFSLSAMLNKPSYINSSFGITLYWGRQDVESEYEKIIRREIKYRKDLLDELSQAAKREEKLKKNISELSSQTDELRYKIEMIEKELKKEKADKENLVKENQRVLNTLNSIVERQKKEKEDLENLERKRQQQKLELIKREFDREMEIYRKLKMENTSKTALINYLKKVISTYQNSGIDISEASFELLLLTKD